jgi:acyl-CoA synthetase (AMP-forming)/AMP-acid ligase II
LLETTAVELERKWPTLVDMCRDRAAENPGRQAYTFLENGAEVSARLTLGELDEAARTIASALAELAPAGSRVLIGYPAGLDFVTGFFGALYAGMIAVPIPPVDGSVTEAQRARLDAIANSARPAVFLTTSSALAAVTATLSTVPALRGAHVLATDALDRAGADKWTRPDIPPRSPAYLQYSSGSTGLPKGVVLSHRSVIHNLALILENAGDHERAAEGLGRRPMASWLPMFHDMGLVSGVIEPVFVGYDVVLMPPHAFVQRPVNWLRAISDLGEANSAAPNFAYDLCVRRVGELQRAKLDLSGWQVALIGAEPVRASVLRRFAETFAPQGFRPEAFFPAYGLAESTVMVSGGPPGSGAVIGTFDAVELAAGRVRPPLAGRRSKELVGCGHIHANMTVVIADPATLEPVEADAVGEILVAGGSIGTGYWNAPEESERTFGNRVPGYGDLPFLRTGDLGFVHGGQLFITGRLKDVIIIGGFNHYPQDIEASAGVSHPAVREGFCSAISVDDGADGERLVVIAEIAHPYRLVDDAAQAADRPNTAVREDVVAAIRAAGMAEHGVAVSEVVLVQLGTLPFTSSAKLQRAESRRRFLAGEYTEAGRYGASPARRG